MIKVFFAALNWMPIKDPRGMCHNSNINRNTVIENARSVERNPFNYRLYSPSYSSYVSGIKYSCSQWIFHDLWNWLIRHWWLSFRVFFFTARLLKNCYQDTWLKSEEFCTNGLCLTFAMSIKRLHRRATNVNIAQKRENLHLIVFESENVFILTYTVE